MSSETVERKQGRVKKFFPAGYGFLFCVDIPVDVFFHMNHWRSADEPVVGQQVTFSLGPSKFPEHADHAMMIRPVINAGLEALAKPIHDDAIEIGVKAVN
jgi:cold shock CspA family protein